MTLVAALHWEVSAKRISYLIYDSSNGAIRVAPTKFSCSKSSFQQFTTDVSLALNSFFQELALAKSSGHTISLIYKIVGKSGPILHHAQRVQRGNHSDFVDSTFHAHVGGLGLPTHRLRSDLKKPELTEFTNILLGLSLITKKKSDSFKVKIWMTALSATKSTYKNKCFNLYWTTLANGTKRKVAKMQYSQWLVQL